jgi:hypothetical protein
MPRREADWAALVPYDGIQKKPVQLTGLVAAAPPQITVVVAIPKLTPGGTNGSLTIVNGLVTNTVAPT